jgi:hypothetical protein
MGNVRLGVRLKIIGVGQAGMPVLPAVISRMAGLNGHKRAPACGANLVVRD